MQRPVPDYAGAARVDMGFKHFAFILGAIGGNFNGATVHAYGPLYGSGGAVVEFDLDLTTVQRKFSRRSRHASLPAGHPGNRL